MATYSLNLGAKGMMTADIDKELTEDDILDLLGEDILKKAFNPEETDVESLKTEIEAKLKSEGFSNISWS